MRNLITPYVVADYTPVSENRTIQPSSQMGTCVTVNTLFDTEGEDREYFTVRMALLSGGLNVTEGSPISANVLINGMSKSDNYYNYTTKGGDCFCPMPQMHITVYDTLEIRVQARLPSTP